MTSHVPVQAAEAVLVQSALMPDDCLKVEGKLFCKFTPFMMLLRN
jgi:hypothetical protein